MSGKPVVPVDEEAVKAVIQSKEIYTAFQPIVSVSTKSVVGFESFSRGGNSMDPTMLFHPDLSPETKLEVDRLCREKSLLQFRSILGSRDDLLLFMNINPAILSHVKEKSSYLKEQIEAYGIDPENVVVEIPMCAATSMVVLEYADLYRSFGFKTGLDACSIHDTWGKLISALKPQFVKVGHSFYDANDSAPYAAKALEGLLEVADKAGSVVIGQGVEKEEDSFRLLMSGINLQQGFYYTKDEKDMTGDPTRMFFRKIAATYDRYKKVRGAEVKSRKERVHAMFKSVTAACNRFVNVPQSKFETSCRALSTKLDEIVSIFVLDGQGIQLTSRPHTEPAPGRSACDGIVGTGVGVDHSLNDYVVYLDMGYGKFVSPPFTSHYTGEPACIVSKPFIGDGGKRYILCVEMPYPA
ncbi:EAL domain-containing protein [Pseudodesulfovibrio sp. zrk46]|uniref:EAL domain-containing protein n=1 Tax=Pseudodesulfovibrio sp. zrk46 TaxID=2725288 RepID=UPI001448FBFA|nr:EAL domain-containing protein [Pseudodesulfovibrio sp. zrk46]QJB56484.1 EAL domain-containing protein [Pseudodesulfovibrio sp. zrk46]